MPERVAELAEVALAGGYADADSFANATRAITLAVNEALEDAKKACADEIDVGTINPSRYLEGWNQSIAVVIMAINDLKLKEE